MEISELLLKWINLRNENIGREDIAISTSKLETRTDYGELRLAVSPHGDLKLLIPVGPHDELPLLEESDTLRIQASSFTIDNAIIRFLDIHCLEKELNKVFIEVAIEIIHRIDVGEKTSVAVKNTLSDFRRLLKLHSSKISMEKAIGLLGELLILDELITMNQEIWKSWMGPEGDRNDFRSGDISLECKATSRPGKSVVEISSFDQLERIPNGELFLFHIVLEHNSKGKLEVPKIAEKIFKKSGSPEKLLEKYNKSGLKFDDPKAWENLRFDFIKKEVYAVTEKFPALTKHSFKDEDILIGVKGITYSIDLAAARKFIISEQEVQALYTRYCK